MSDMPTRVGDRWVWFDGYTLPVVSGGSDVPPQPPPGTPPPTPPAPPTPPPTPPAPPAPPSGGGKVDDLSKLNDWMKGIAAREKAEGRASVEKQIAEMLGMTLDEAKTVMDKHQEAEREKMTAAEKKEADAKKLREDARGDVKMAHDLILDMIKQDALMNLGMTRDQARGAVQLVNVEVANTPEMTLANVVTAAEQVKMLYPQLFTPNGRPGPTDSANRGAPPGGNTGGSGAKDRAIARLRDRSGGRLRSDIQQERRPAEFDYTRRSGA